MITRKEAFAELKKLIGLKFDAIVPAPIPNVAPVVAVDDPAMPVDYPLADGRVLTIDKCEVGGMVTINGEPAPDEVYVLADGTTITTALGLITEKEMAEVEPVETPAEMKSTLQQMVADYESKTAEKLAAINTAITAYQSGFATQANEIDALKKENANLKVIAAKTLAMMEQVGENLVAAPLEESEEKLTSYQKHQLKSVK